MRELGTTRKLWRAEEGLAIGRGSEFIGRGIKEREREILGKIERAREIERQKINSEEGDNIGIQEVERKQRRRKNGEIGRSKEEKKRM